MKDYVNIGSSPHGEDCAHVGSDDYGARSRIELREYMRMLNAQHPAPKDGISHLAAKSFPHDFGNYHEVVAHYDDSSAESVSWAFAVEGNDIEHWDAEAVKALGL